jgi:hypothetical protein
MFQNLKLFEHQCDTISGKLHTWPHVMDCNQNAGALKILYKITFKQHIKVVYENNEFPI